MTGETLVGVNITLASDRATGTATDIDGGYTLRVGAGEVTLVFSYLGYETVEQPVTVVAGQTIRQDVALAEETRLMDQVVVTGSLYEKKLGEETMSMEVIRPEQIDRINAVSVEQAIERVPGVNVVDGQVNIRAGAGYSYGAGTRVLLLYNDMPIVQADAGRPNWTAVPVENIGQVEILKGAASVLYGSSAINGVINLRSAEPVTKPYFRASVFGGVVGLPADNMLDSTGRQKAWWRDSADAAWPQEAGLSLAYRKKFGDFDLSTGGYFIRQEGFRLGEFDRRGRINVLTRYRIKDGLNVSLDVLGQVGKSGRSSCGTERGRSSTSSGARWAHRPPPTPSA